MDWGRRTGEHVAITSTEARAIAARYGCGRIIEARSGRPLHHIEDLRDVVASMPPGATVVAITCGRGVIIGVLDG
jgi:hypothetical protein